MGSVTKGLSNPNNGNPGNGINPLPNLKTGSPGKTGIIGTLGENVFGEGAGGHFGTAGGFGGTGLPAPTGVDVQQGTNVNDVQQAQAGTNNALGAQNDLLAALQGQGGLAAQNQMYNNIGNTAGQYQNIAAGRGPNPAQAMLNQQTGQNIQNQAAMMAGQRGAGANVGLMARQAGQMGGNMQQQAVGQGAAMQANQQLNALQGLLGAQGAQSGLANTMAGQQIGQANANAQAQLANQQAQQQALNAYNQAQIANQGNVTAANTSLQNSYIHSQEEGLKKFADMSGGMMNGGGAGMMMAEGGAVINPGMGQNEYAETNPFGFGAPEQANMPQSSFGKFLSNPEGSSDSYGNSTAYKNGQSIGKMWQGGSQPTQTNSSSMAGPDSSDIGSGGTMTAYSGGLAHSGGPVKAKAQGEKAVTSGDNYSNDKIDAKLSEGEIVIPRSITMGKDPVKGAADFVAKVLAKRKVK